MKLKPFAVERYFARYEFNARYLLSSSDCDGYSMQYVLGLASDEERARWAELKLGYTETLGSEPLRQAIAQHYKNIKLNEILVASPGEANFALMNVLLNAGDNIVCQAPLYQSLYQVAKDLNCTVSRWLPENVANGWYFNPDDLKKLITPATKLIVINFPHNPTGFSPSLAEFQAIVDIARAHGLPLFSDEMYRFLHYDRTATLPSACDLYENAVSLWGAAKSFGLAGLRLGWLTSKNREILKRVECFKDYLSICNNAPSEVLATIALNNLESFLKPNIEKILANSQAFEEFATRHAEIFGYKRPNSGSTAFVKVKLPYSSMDFSEKVVKEAGIMLLPAETFEYGSEHVRIGFGRQNMKEVLGHLETYLKQAMPTIRTANRSS